MAIRITTDSAADFDREVAKRRKIDIVSLSVQFGSASFLDGKNLTTEVFYKLLKEGKENPKTAQPSPADFLTLFEEAKATKGQPTVIIANTTKGFGSPVMENQAGWHGKAPNEEEYKIAMEDLEKAGEALCQK